MNTLNDNIAAAGNDKHLLAILRDLRRPKEEKPVRKATRKIVRVVSDKFPQPKPLSVVFVGLDYGEAKFVPRSWYLKNRATLSGKSAGTIVFLLRREAEERLRSRGNHAANRNTQSGQRQGSRQAASASAA